MIRLKDLEMKDYVDKIIYVTALVAGVKELTAKNNSPYVEVTLRDKSKREVTRLFNKTKEDIDSLLQEGNVYTMECKITEFRDNPQLNIVSVKSNTELERHDFIESVEDVDVCIKIIEDTIAGLPSLFSEPIQQIYNKNKHKFKTHPAAKSMHHEIIGGLALHTSTMLQSAQSIHKVYPNLNLPLINSIIILHDMGKVMEFDVSNTGEVTYNNEGLMLGHILLVMSELEKTLSLINLTYTDEEYRLILALKNGIVSHHGRLEWGSPVKPVTAEARLVHYIDMIDSEMYKAKRETNNINQGEIKAKFNNRPDVDNYFKL